MSIIQDIRRMGDAGVIDPPSFVLGGLQWVVMMGSVAYGVSTDDSDIDIYGWTIPPRSDVFPHLKGEIEGFGRQKQHFNQWQKSHVHDSVTNKDYDFSIYNIVRYFSLCMEGNPNMLDSLFVPSFCVIYSTKIGDMVRDSRHLFLHKGIWHKMKGYAYSQLKKARDRNPVGKRREVVEKFGWDVKSLYHVARLLDQCEQVLTYGVMDLQRSREQMKAIREGRMSLEDVERWFACKEVYLEKLYHESIMVPYAPDEKAIKDLLLRCLEEYYGSLEKCIVSEDRAVGMLRQIQGILDSNRRVFQ